MIRASLRNGETVTLASKHGATPEAVVDSVSVKALTGSAAQVLEDEDGNEVLYSDVIALEWAE